MAAGVARANARELGLDLVEVRAEDVERFLLSGPSCEPFGLVLLDPPYDIAEDTLADVLALLVHHDWLAPEALVVVERSARSPEPRWPARAVRGRRASLRRDQDVVRRRARATTRWREAGWVGSPA